MKVHSTCPVLSTDIILEIILASKSLIANTKKDDVLVFIGQSPDFFSHITKEERHVISVPFGGRPFCDELSIPSKTQLDNFSKLLQGVGITRNLLDTKNVILVDHSHSGTSISCFVKVILRCFDYIDRESRDLGASSRIFKFINIVDNVQYPGWIAPPPTCFIETVGYLLMPNLVAFANEGEPHNSSHKIPRTVPSYQYWKWDSEPCFSSVPERIPCIQKIRLYHEFYKKYTSIHKNSQVADVQDLGMLLYFVDMLVKSSTNTKHAGMLSTITKTTSDKVILQVLGAVLCTAQVPIRFIRAACFLSESEVKC